MNDGQRFTFKKEERVTGEKRIDNLFTNGNAFMAYPFRVVFLETETSTDFPLSILVSIPKKRIKSAVNRNRMKRLVREAYRLNKHLFYNEEIPENYHLDVAFIYVKDELSEYETVEKAVRKALNELIKQLREKKQC